MIQFQTTIEFKWAKRPTNKWYFMIRKIKLDFTICHEHLSHLDK